jgi:hypothetical protein
MLTERIIQKSVNIMTIGENKVSEVLWVDQVLRGEEVIAESNHRCAYTAENKEQFLAEVEKAELYMTILGWE